MHSIRGILSSKQLLHQILHVVLYVTIHVQCTMYVHTVVIQNHIKHIHVHVAWSESTIYMMYIVYYQLTSTVARVKV